jgi:hypothetical protein
MLLPAPTLLPVVAVDSFSARSRRRSSRTTRDTLRFMASSHLPVAKYSSAKR